jgi:integrase
MTEHNGIPAPAITSDNIHLSKVIPTRLDDAAVSNPLAPLGCTDPKILEFIAAATAANTRRAYQSDLRHFLAWGGPLPATPEQVARYLADHAAILSMATLARRLAGIRAAHVERGFPDPTKGELIRLTFRGIRRRCGNPQRRVAPLKIEHLSAVISVLGNSIRDIRDRALLLIGFAGAFRRSELSAIQCNWVTRTKHGISIRLPRCKTDQESRGRNLAIPFLCGSICPVAALDAWLEVSGITDGPLFRRVSKSGGVFLNGLSTSAVATIVKQRAAQVGLDPTCLSGHSLRAGFATSAAVAGLPMWRIKRQTGHVSDTVVGRYVREDDDDTFLAASAAFGFRSTLGCAT